MTVKLKQPKVGTVLPLYLVQKWIGTNIDRHKMFENHRIERTVRCSYGKR